MQTKRDTIYFCFLKKLIVLIAHQVSKTVYHYKCSGSFVLLFLFLHKLIHVTDFSKPVLEVYATKLVLLLSVVFKITRFILKFSKILDNRVAAKN